MDLFKEHVTCFKEGLSHFTQPVLSNWLYMVYRLYLLGHPHRVLAVGMAPITQPCFYFHSVS